MTNVWPEPAVRGAEGLKNGSKCVHTNQKPLSLLGLIVDLCTEPGDVVWDPFAGLCSVGVAASQMGRVYHGAEKDSSFFWAACKRLKRETDVLFPLTA